MPTVGIVSPGAMGSALADALARGGVQVVATVAGRSARTQRLAAQAPALELRPDLESVVRESNVVISIVPPGDAEDAAAAIVDAAAVTGSAPLLAELNAIAPARAARIAEAAEYVGVELVDGSLSGPPPWKPGTTRLYLSGPRAEEVAALPFDGVERIVVGSEVGSASAVKMSTASVYKGSSALLAQALRAAQANGVLEHVLEDLRTAAPELLDRVERRLATAASKSDRYVDEMREIASTQQAAGLTPALFEGVAEVFEELAATELAAADPESVPSEASLGDVLDRLELG